jgi:Meckel syndrome type 1 protein
MDETQLDEIIGKANGELTEEEIARLLGDDAGKTPEDAGTVDAGNPAAQDGDPPDGGTKDADKAPENPEDIDPANTVIKSKSGTYTIEYEKLIEARNEAKSYREQAEANRAALEALQREIAAKSATSPEDSGKGGAGEGETGKNAGPRFGDFSEKELAAGIEKLVAEKLELELAQKLEPLKQAIAPIADKQARAEHSAHEQAIYAAHADADSIVESKEFSAWLQAQPGFARQAAVQVLEKGSTTEVVELFDTFKASPYAPKSGAGEAVRAAAAAAIAKAAAAPPMSLTDLSGGKPGATGTKAEQVRALDDPLAMLAALEGESPEKIDEILNSL